MTYKLYIGNRLYFSWSLSAFLMFDRFGLRDSVQSHVLYAADSAELQSLMKDHAPARTLPTVITPEGAILNDSMAIAEELATRHPDIAFWPANPIGRSTARALANEMHSSFGGLRSNWAFNARTHYETQEPPPEITVELERLEELWAYARAKTKPNGPWLCGDYSLVDAIFAPMAIRLACYGFHTRPATTAYVKAHLADPAFRRWRAMGLAKGHFESRFEIDAPTVPWRGPERYPAKIVTNGPAENETCPYSGDQVTHFMELDGRVFGFCNAFCRDKTIADPQAWPRFWALV